MEKKELILKILEELDIKTSLTEYLTRTFNTANSLAGDEDAEDKAKVLVLFDKGFNDLLDIYVASYEKHYTLEELEASLQLVSSPIFKQSSIKTKVIETEMQQPMMVWLEKTFAELFK